MTDTQTKKVIGFKLFVIGTASIMGPWLLLTSQWIGYTGASVALAFLGCGLLCIPIALCYGELTAMFKNKGGTYEYVRAAYGREAGYWISWTTIFSYIVVTLFQIICISMLLQYMLDFEMTTAMVLAVSIVLMLMMTALNTRDMSIATTLQTAMFFVLASVGILYVICFFCNDAFDISNWEPFFQEGMVGYNDIIGMDAGFLLAMAALVTMFFGFELIPQFASESSYPNSKVWKLMVGGIMFVIAFDSLLCLAESGMISLDPTMTNFEYISSLYEQNGMVSATFAEAYVGDWLKIAICIANFCCMGCCMVGFWMGTAHTLCNMGKGGSIPLFFGKENKHGMPTIGNYFMLMACIVLTVIAVSSDTWLNACFSLMALGIGFTYLGAALAFVKLRKKYPEAERPWIAPGGLVTGYIAIAAGAFMSIMMVWTVISAALQGDYTMLIMVIVYFAIIGIVRFILKRDEEKNPDRYSHEEDFGFN